MTDFADRVREVVRSLPAGEVVSYGEVAAMAGRPGAARGAGAVLASSGRDDLPWWRVVYASGRLVPGKEAAQARHLRGEGVEVDTAASRVRFSRGGRWPPPSRARS
ncbi:MAG TPA: MGMT family protein [Acidimicrobiales bacterium]|nr:MGMT family protein [Acidimicrobiales bacterium]